MHLHNYWYVNEERIIDKEVNNGNKSNSIKK